MVSIKKKSSIVASIFFASVMVFALMGCSGKNNTVKSTINNKKAKDFNEWTYTDFKNEEWNSKTVKYVFNYGEKWSYGGVNGNKEMRYVTDYFKAFLYLYEDGTILGYFLNNIGMDEYMRDMFDPDNRIQLQYVGYWEENNNVITMRTMMKNEINNPTEFVTTTVELKESGVTEFDFYTRRVSDYLPEDADESAKAYYNGAYGLRYDGSIPFASPEEEAEAVNADWDELLE